MRDDPLRLQDILDAIAAIQRHMPPDRQAFDANEPVRSHILLHIQIIGEASSKVGVRDIPALKPQIEAMLGSISGANPDLHLRHV
jgi:uncharacterized protein with HEPN domain